MEGGSPRNPEPLLKLAEMYNTEKGLLLSLVSNQIEGKLDFTGSLVLVFKE